MNKEVLLFLALILLCFSGLLANPPRWIRIAKGKAENFLAGIDVYGTTIDQVILRFGPPFKVTSFKHEEIRKSNNLPWGGEKGRTSKVYKWEWPGLKIEVSAMCFPIGAEEGAVKEDVFHVLIKGDKPGEIGVTGRGLRLGNNLSDIKRIYGRRINKWKGWKSSRNYVAVRWEDKTILILNFDDNERVNHIGLLSWKEWNE